MAAVVVAGVLAGSLSGCSGEGPVVVDDAVDADGAYRALVDLGGEAGRACTDDWAAQEWDLPVPSDLAPAAVIRLQLDGEADTAYEYPMGDSRPG